MKEEVPTRTRSGPPRDEAVPLPLWRAGSEAQRKDRGGAGGVCGLPPPRLPEDGAVPGGGWAAGAAAAPQ